MRRAGWSGLHSARRAEDAGAAPRGSPGSSHARSPAGNRAGSAYPELAESPRVGLSDHGDRGEQRGAHARRGRRGDFGDARQITIPGRPRNPEVPRADRAGRRPDVGHQHPCGLAARGRPRWIADRVAGRRASPGDCGPSPMATPWGCAQSSPGSGRSAPATAHDPGW